MRQLRLAHLECSLGCCALDKQNNGTAMSAFVIRRPSDYVAGAVGSRSTAGPIAAITRHRSKRTKTGLMHCNKEHLYSITCSDESHGDLEIDSKFYLGGFQLEDRPAWRLQALQLQDASLQTSSHCACGGNR